MICLEQNIIGLCEKNGLSFNDFLNDFEVDHVLEMSLFDLQALCEEYKLDLQSLMFKPIFHSENIKQKAAKIKLLVMDVDGVLTDGGMYITENGDQIKKYNTKDGMAIQFLRKNGIEPCIISSSLTTEMVVQRAKMLGITRYYVGKASKMEILQNFCKDLNINLNQVAMVGDDINDLEIIKSVGLSACPSDAVNMIKSNTDIILTKKGGEGCVREFIDFHLLTTPITYEK